MAYARGSIAVQFSKYGDIVLKTLCSVLLLSLLGAYSWAGDIVVQSFSGLNTQDSPATIDPSQSQDLLNVLLTPGGSAVYKREGYGLYKTLPTTSTEPIHGGHHFQQTISGSDVQLWYSSATLSASVAGASFVVIATGTKGATIQCSDSGGYAYCLTSSRDTCIKTDGTTVAYSTGVPLGTMVTFTPTQMVVAGISGNENTLYVSAQNTPTYFTIGTLPSSAFTEPVNAPGARLTHIGYYFGKLFWWKDQSFGFMTFTNQNDLQLTIVSNQIGTLDNSSAFWNSGGYDTGSKFTGTSSASAGQTPGGIYFRGQDNHLYVYDGYYLTRLSRIITPTITGANRRKMNSWTQTNATDWSSGSFAPTVNFSTSISVGDITVSSYSAVDTSTTDFSAGTFSNTFPINNSVRISTDNAGNYDNNSFESALSGNWEISSGELRATSSSSNCGTVTPYDGSYFVIDKTGQAGVTKITVTMRDISGNTILDTQYFDVNPGACAGWQTANFYSPTNVGKRVNIEIKGNGNCSGYVKSIPSYVLGSTITFKYRADPSGTIVGGSCSGQQGNYVSVDLVTGGSSTITSGSFTSRIFDTAFSSTVVQIQANWTVNTTTPYFELQTSANGTTGWTKIASSTGTSGTGQRYLRYVSSLTVGSLDNALTTIDDVTMVAMSTGGVYYSAVDNAPNFSNWSTFGANDVTTGGSLTYLTRAATSYFTVTSSTPTWYAQGKNATVAAATGTYMQAMASFTVTNATGTLALNEFTFNWFEGSAADKAYMAYFNDAIWFAVSASSSVSTNNRIFYWDILNAAWMIHDIPSNGLLIENNNLYIGSPLSANVYKYGGVTTDAGSSINSYWRSKAFLGTDPFVQNEYVQSDFVLGQSSTSLTYTYTLDSSISTPYSFTVYDSSASLIQRNFLLPKGKIGKYYDFKISENSDRVAWRLMGHRVHYNALNWRPVLQ